MDFKHQLWPSFGPLPLRILVGVAFIVHGALKFPNMQGTAGFFSSVGIPAELAIPITMLEVAGGVALLAGALTRISASILIAEMIGATLVVKLTKGFVGGYEIDLLLLSMCASLLLTGPGRFSVEWQLGRELIPGGRDMMRNTKSQERPSSQQIAARESSKKVYTSDGKLKTTR